MRKVNQYSDVLSGILIIVVAAALLVGSGFIQQRAGTGSIGPRTMPQIVAVLLAITGVGILASGLKKRRNHVHQGGTFPENGRDSLVVFLTLGLLAAYIAVISSLGFLLSTTLYLFVQLSLLENEWRQRMLRSAVIAVATSACTYFLFRNVFSLMLPTGVLF